MLSILGYSNCFSQPWQVLRKASPIRAGMVPCPDRPFGTETDFAARYGLRLVFYTEGSLDSIKISP